MKSRPRPDLAHLKYSLIRIKGLSEEEAQARIDLLLKHEKDERKRLKSTQMPHSKLIADINNQLGLPRLISEQNTKKEGK